MIKVNIGDKVHLSKRPKPIIAFNEIKGHIISIKEKNRYICPVIHPRQHNCKRAVDGIPAARSGEPVGLHKNN